MRIYCVSYLKYQITQKISGSLAKDNDQLAVNFSYLVTFFKEFSLEFIN